MSRFTLNGDWKLTYNDLKHKEDTWGKWIPAKVPGDVHLDLLREGIIPEPLISDNSKKMTWIEEKEWWYKKSFLIEGDFIKDKVAIIFEGLDLSSTIWVNGVEIGQTNNMFVAYRFDITGLIHQGSNEVMVRLDVGFEKVKDKPFEVFTDNWNDFDIRRLWMRKATQAFFWDIAPRLMTLGIWRGVHIDSYEGATIADCYVTSAVHNGNAKVNVGVELEGVIDQAGEYTIEVQMADGTASVQQQKTIVLTKGTTHVDIGLEVKEAKLWWPNGLGDQHLYDITVNLYGAGKKHIAHKKLRHGIRSIEIVQDALNEREKTFTFVVNGIKVFCKGGDWVPSDSIYARITEAQERKLVEMAKDCNFNMFRVWGGGIYPDNNFFEACDENGIMVWQDFMFACGFYPDFEDEFCDTVTDEVNYIVRKYRNHASLALWSGNNENYEMHDKLKFDDMPMYGDKIYQQIIPHALQSLDPVNLYWPSSPYGGEPAHTPDMGDQHIWDYSMGWFNNTENALKIWDFTEKNHKFVSEFGITCPSNMFSARKYLGEHTVVKDNEVWDHHLCYYALGLYEKLFEVYYKDAPVDSFEEYTLAGQMIQAEAIKDIVEEFRSRMFVNSGTLYWQYNESWGHMGYPPVDYYLLPKASYYYMQRAFEFVRPVFKDNGGDIMILNDTRDDLALKIEYGCMTFDGSIVVRQETSCLAKATASTVVGQLTDDDLAGADLTQLFGYIKVFQDGKLISRNRKFYVPFKELKLPADNKKVEVIDTNDIEKVIRLSSDKFVWCANIDPTEDFSVSDNAFDIWPGEIKDVKITLAAPSAAFNPTINTVSAFISGGV